MTDMGLNEDVRAFLAMMAANQRPPFTAEVIAMMRQMPPDMMAALDLPVGDIATDRSFEIPGPAGPIGARLFDSQSARGAGPMVIFYHGGGFVVGNIATHAGLAADVARMLDLPVVSIEYRLAPENPWPAGVEDAEAAARWLAENGATIGRAATSLVLMGDSAGGNLAIVTALALRDRPAAAPVALQVPIYPVTDQRGPTPSRAAFGDGYGLDSADMALFHQHYACDPDDWRASPIIADLTGLPPALVVTAAFDPLRDEGRAYAARLIEAGVETSFMEMPGTIHGFCSYRRMIPSAVEHVARFLAAAKALLARQSASGKHETAFG